MIHCWYGVAKLSAIGACCSLAVWISSTNAKDDEASVLVKKPEAAAAQGPLLPPPAKPANPTQVFLPPEQSTGPAVVKPKLTPPAVTQPPTKSTVKRPFMQPAQPREPVRGQLSAQSEPMPTPEGTPLVAAPSRDPNVRPTPPIKYDTDSDARKMYRSGQVQLVMITQDPADGCLYEIPMCIPACCTGEPTVSGGRGLFGRGVVEYCWPCGFRAEVKFRHLLGDVKVEYEGD